MYKYYFSSSRVFFPTAAKGVFFGNTPMQNTQKSHASDEQGEYSDDDAAESGNLYGLAERKRRLERNRRNLINVRFTELKTELDCFGNGGQDSTDSGKQHVTKPRLDKEAILKEATMRLIVQHNELTSTNARLKTLLAQIASMRGEIADLRNDKRQLQTEAERLRSNNSSLIATVIQSDSPSLLSIMDSAEVLENLFGSPEKNNDVSERTEPILDADIAINDSNIILSSSRNNKLPASQSLSHGVCAPLTALDMELGLLFSPPRTNASGYMQSATSTTLQNAAQSREPSIRMSVLDELTALLSSSVAAHIPSTHTAATMTTGFGSIGLPASASSTSLVSGPFSTLCSASSTESILYSTTSSTS